jgi:hypothetical protein
LCCHDHFIDRETEAHKETIAKAQKETIGAFLGVAELGFAAVTSNFA